jgi:hypothetical protein
VQDSGPEFFSHAHQTSGYKTGPLKPEITIEIAAKSELSENTAKKVCLEQVSNQRGNFL